MRELTVGEVKEVMQMYEAKDTEIPFIDVLFPDAPVPAYAVSKSAGMEIEDLENLPASELDKKIKEAGELNPFFVRMLGKSDKVLEQTT